MGRRKKLFWRFYIAGLPIILLSIAAIGWYSLDSLKTFHYENLAKNLQDKSLLFSEMIEDSIKTNDFSRTDALCKKAGRGVDTRFSVVLLSGKVIGDSEKDPGSMDNHSDRPEIQQAIKGRIGVSKRYSYTLKKEMIYVSVPLLLDDSVYATVRTSMPIPVIVQNLRDVYIEVIIALLVVAFFAAIMSFLVINFAS